MMNETKPVAIKERPRLIQPHMLARPMLLRGFFDLEQRMAPFPPFLSAVLLLQLFVFAWSGYTYMWNPADNLLTAGQFQGYWLMEPQGWARAVTATFLHAGLEHLIGNLALLYIAGVVIEHVYGFAAMATVCGVSFLGQAVASYVFYDPAVATVGASGVVFGLVGFLLAFYARYRREIFIRHRTVGLVLAALSLHAIWQGLETTYVNNAAHLGGFVAGLALGFVLEAKFTPGERRVSRGRRALTIFALVALVLLPFAWMNAYLSPREDLEWSARAANLVDFLFQPSGVRSPTYEHRLVDVMDEAVNQAGGEEGEDGPASEAKPPENDGARPSEDLDRAQRAGEDEQGRSCPVCRPGADCHCDPECKWTYFHHYADANCAIKLKTTVWGPNTGSPFRRGFDESLCVEAAGRYYRWESARPGCAAPRE